MDIVGLSETSRSGSGEICSRGFIYYWSSMSYGAYLKGIDWVYFLTNIFETHENYFLRSVSELSDRHFFLQNLKTSLTRAKFKCPAVLCHCLTRASSRGMMVTLVLFA